MSILRRLFLLAVAIQPLTAVPAAADFRVCYDADQDIMSAVSCYDQRQQTWHMAGWFAIATRSCQRLTTGDVRDQRFHLNAQIGQSN